MTNLNTPIIDFDGNDIGVTLKEAVLQALLSPMPGDEAMDGGIKIKLFVLAGKVSGADKLALTAEETAMLKERSGKLFTPLVVGRIWQAIDPASVPIVNEQLPPFAVRQPEERDVA